MSYSLHSDFNRESTVDSKKLLEEMMSDVGMVTLKPSPDVKSELVLCDVLRFRLEELRLRIEIEPNIQNHSLSFGDSNCRLVENRLVNDCNSDEAYRNLVLDKISDKLLKVSEARSKAQERIRELR